MSSNEILNEQIHLDKTIQNIENQTYLVSELVESKREKMKSGHGEAGDQVVYKKGKEEQRLLQEAIKNPYFGKLEMVSKEYGDETFYIGKQGIRDEDENRIVIDWRMPIAKVYYNFTPGNPKQGYLVVDKRHNQRYKYVVKVNKKREFVIKNQRITKIIQQVPNVLSKENKTITETEDALPIADEFLAEMIENSQTTGYLKEIIATIQSKQDLVIRETIDKNIIVQGAAGSGKSSIALHRLSYLLFNNENLSPESLLILGPSNMFLSSVKGLLPELNLEGIQQTTVQNLMLDMVRPYLEGDILLDNSLVFKEVLYEHKNEQEYRRIQFKGSEQFLKVLNLFLEDFEKHYERRIHNLTILDERLNTTALQEIYRGYLYLPLVKRIEKFIWHVENLLERKLEETLEEHRKQYDFVINTYLKDGGLSQDEHLSVAVKMRRVLDYKIKNTQSKFKEQISLWKESIKVPDLMQLYKQITSYELLSSFKNEIDLEYLEAFKDNTEEQLTSFDLAPIFYMYLNLYEPQVKYAHIVIDEAQDLSYIHFAALKKITRTMTILGDNNQSILMNYGQYDWEYLLTSLFNRKDDAILDLNTSYRSTKEIVDTANAVLKKQKGVTFESINPLNRNGEPVSFKKVDNGDDLLDSIVATLREWSGKYKRVAVIHKDEQRAKKLAEDLKGELKEVPDVKYINPDQEVGNNTISVLASYHSKGMEFDGVILVNVDDKNFPLDNLHARLLYVLLTRAQQEVKAFYCKNPSPLIRECLKPPKDEHAYIL
ncbi:UvrD-helicase domain-containing protein [Bacillus sp. AGMB 02131]|uniref:DNA 3'-5' helicase n=1 Tax=Peribacillus faecalis TaxID=2772559 RepID=A0A927HAI6_9BACI|nr:3'-5' exonuclease [Peribacillus faecalis]MBD3107496.1 UvrD-helicase domain-containing protein [Peribacillus faecalis]